MTYFAFSRYFQRLVFMTIIPKTNIERDFCEVIRSTTKPKGDCIRTFKVYIKIYDVKCGSHMHFVSTLSFYVIFFISIHVFILNDNAELWNNNELIWYCLYCLWKLKIKWLLKRDKYFQPCLMFDFISFTFLKYAYFKKVTLIFKKVLSERSALLSS